MTQPDKDMIVKRLDWIETDICAMADQAKNIPQTAVTATLAHLRTVRAIVEAQRAE